MPVTVNRELNGYSALVGALNTLQVFLGRPVTPAVDNQMIASEIIKLQTYMSTVVATNPPSNKKFDPAKINFSIDDQLLAVRLIEAQTAANIA